MALPNRTGAVRHCDRVTNRDSPYVRVMGSALTQRCRGPGLQERFGEETRYRGAIVALHHASSLSSSTTRHALDRAERIISRSDDSIPLKIAWPPGASASRIAGRSSSNTDE